MNYFCCGYITLKTTLIKILWYRYFLHFNQETLLKALSCQNFVKHFDWRMTHHHISTPKECVRKYARDLSEGAIDEFLFLCGEVALGLPQDPKDAEDLPYEDRVVVHISCSPRNSLFTAVAAIDFCGIPWRQLVTRGQANDFGLSLYTAIHLRYCTRLAERHLCRAFPRCTPTSFIPHRSRDNPCG